MSLVFVCPSPFSVGPPNLPFLLSLGSRGWVSTAFINQPMGSTEGWLDVSMVRVTGLTKPQGSCRDGLSFHLSTLEGCFLPNGKGSEDSCLGVLEPHLASVQWRRGCYRCMEILASSRSSLNDVLTPSKSRPCPKWMSESLLWGDKWE